MQRWPFFVAPLLASAAVAQTQQWTGSEPLEAPYDHASHGIWVGYYDLATRPTTGAAWQEVIDDANGLDETAVDLWNQDSNNDVKTMACALAAVRLDSAALKSKTADALFNVIGTEVAPSPNPPATWLHVSRNITGYTIAADLLKMDGLWAQAPWQSKVIAFDEWLHDLLDGTTLIKANNSNEMMALGSPRKILPFASGSNGASQEGLCYVAMSAYFREYDRLAYGWERFRVLVGDRPVLVNNTYSPAIGTIRIDQGIASGWAGQTPPSTVPITPISGEGRYLDWPIGCWPDPEPGCLLFNGRGVILNDMRRGDVWKLPTVVTQYPWVGLEGIFPAAVILHRFGYDALNAADGRVGDAVAALAYWNNQAQSSMFCTANCWWDYDRATDIKHLFNAFYTPAGGWPNLAPYPYETPVGKGRTVGYTDWTHPL